MREGKTRLATIARPTRRGVEPPWKKADRLYRTLRLALINPPQTYPQYLADEYQSYAPIGLAMLGAVAESMGVDVQIFDCLAWPGRQVCGSSITFGLRSELLRLELEAFQPHIVGIANPFSCFLDDALRTARLVKNIDPSVPVILGGVEPSLSPSNRALMETEAAVDILVRGEGEATLCDLIAKYDVERRAFGGLDGVAGIVFRDSDGAAHETPSRPFIGELDELPLPAYHLLDMNRMFANPFYGRLRQRATGVRCMPIHTSRGCPYSCNFCSVHSQVGKPNRRHSPEYVVRHMRHLMEAYDIRHFHFEDDNLTYHVERSRALFEAIAPLGITWDTPNGLRADTISAGLASLMAKSGAKSVTIAVESGSQDVLNDIVQKRLDLADVLEAVKNLSAADIPTIAFFIVGFPGESRDDVEKTLALIKRLAVEHAVACLLFVATPLPGTPLEQECRENGFFVDELNNETILSAIRLNQTPLIATRQFTKADLFHWSRSMLDTPELHALGESIPFIFASTAAGQRTFARLTGEELGAVSHSYWRSRPRFGAPESLPRPSA